MQPSDKEDASLNNTILNCSNVLSNKVTLVTQEPLACNEKEFISDAQTGVDKKETNDLLQNNSNQVTQEVTTISDKLAHSELPHNSDKVCNDLPHKGDNQVCNELPYRSDNEVSQMPINSDNQYPKDTSITNESETFTDLPKPNYELLTNREIKVTQVLFTLKWRLMTQILLALPVIGLFICLMTSLVYHADHINNTICDVYNFLPSISAVTGVSPQRYLWRVCVALHISPRLLVAWVAREFYSSLANRVTAIQRPAYQGMVTLAFVLNLTELATLCGVTYISNKENYPVHEKLFMLFMIASLIYMVCIVHLLKTVEDTLSPLLLRSLAHKKWLLATKISATLGLMFFFWRHRVHCQPKAFSWFSLCEYIIATCNMLYHVSVALDFSDEHLIVGHIVDDERLFVDHIATPTAPSPSVTSPMFSVTSLPTSSSDITQNSFNECLSSHESLSERSLIIDSKGDSKTNSIDSGSSKSYDVNLSNKDYGGNKADNSDECNFSKGLPAIKSTPPKGLDLVASSSYYTKFSGSSNSSTSASSESPCLTDSSSSESSTNSSGNISISSGSFSPDYISSNSSGFVGFCDSGSVKQVLSTIHENPEGGSGSNPKFATSDSPHYEDTEAVTLGHPLFPTCGIQRINPEEVSGVVYSQFPSSGSQNLLDQPEFVIKERVMNSLREGNPGSDEPDFHKNSEPDPKPKTYKDLSFQSLNSQSFSCLEKTHLE